MNVINIFESKTFKKKTENIEMEKKKSKIKNDQKLQEIVNRMMINSDLVTDEELLYVNEKLEILK